MRDFDSIRKDPNYRQLPPKVTVSERPHTVNLLAKPGAKKSGRFFKLTLAVFLFVILGLGTMVVAKTARITSKIFVGQKTSFFQKVGELIRGGSSSQTLVGEDIGQINILLLGIGGEGHDGPYLSDTMILAQIRPDIGEAVLTSIPRDYLVTLPNNLGQRKINAAFAEGFARNKDWNEAGTWARDQVEQLSGLNIPYFAVVDFAGFEKAIDQVGGIDVHVDRAFTDYTFPNDATKGYLPPVTFKEGDIHFDGKQALIFARSRHAAGTEGSDFARSQRQQKVIQAFKNKTLSLNLISDAGTINELVNVFADHFHTNLGPGELFHLYRLVQDKHIQHFSSISLDPETKLICPEILESNGAYVLTPCSGKDDNDVRNFFKNAFSLGKLTEEQSVVWLGTSTDNRSDFNQIYNALTEAGLTVWEVGFGKQNIPKTIVYQVNPKPATTEFIKNTLGATEVNLPPPGLKIDTKKVDVIVILGENNQ